MNPKILLSLTLVLPTLALAAPQTPNAAAPDAEQHSPDDGHDHNGGASTANKGSLTDYLWRRSDDAFHAGDYARAVSLHRAIVAVDPTDVESYGVGAWLLWSLDKRADADAFILQGLKANPKDAEMWDTAAQQYDLEKNYADAQKAFEQAVELSGAEADQMLRRRYAHASEHAGDYAKSAEIWRGLVKDYPTEAVNKNNLARVEEEVAKAQKTSTGGANPAAITTVVGALMVLGVPLAGRLGKSA